MASQDSNFERDTDGVWKGHSTFQGMLRCGNRFAYLAAGPNVMTATDDCEMGFSDNNRDPDLANFKAKPSRLLCMLTS